MIPLPQQPAPPTAAAADLPPRLPAVEVSGLYVHVPFCFHKCHYCDFYSLPGQEIERMGRYVKLLLAEAERWVGMPGPVRRITTVFVGGGTPTLLPPPLMEELLLGLGGRLDLSGVIEWTVEANPATVTPEHARVMRGCGVDRISFGAQSFEPAELALLERHHHPQDVGRSVQIARDCGFQRLNLDLIYAIPGQTLESWERSLQRAIDTGVSHLSCYNLTYEPNTPLAVKQRLGQVRPVEEDVELQQFHHARRRLSEAGLRAYEISNYAAPGQECRHNLLYWNGGSYMGLGPSASSHVGGWRWKNRPHLGAWESAIAEGRLPATDVEHLEPEQRAGELAMLQLRLSRGIEFDDYAARSGYDARTIYADRIAQLQGLGLLEVDGWGFRLTQAGLNVADAVAAEFLSVPRNC